MSSEANVQLLKEAYRQWNDSRGASVDSWFDKVIGPQIKFDSIPRGAEPVPFAKRYDDRTELRGYFDGLLADRSMQYYTMNEYVAQGDTVVALTEVAVGDEKGSDADVFTIRAGKTARVQVHTDTALMERVYGSKQHAAH